MDIRAQLLSTHSKANTQLIVAWIGQRPARAAQLIELFVSDEKLIVQRAAWVVSDLGCKHPQLLLPHAGAILMRMQNPLHSGVLRNGFKYFAETKVRLPEEEEGQLVGLSFDVLCDPQGPVAAQAHAMRCIAHLLPRYPDLAIELKEIIEGGMEYGSAGYQSVGGKILKKIARLSNAK